MRVRGSFLFGFGSCKALKPVSTGTGKFEQRCFGRSLSNENYFRTLCERYVCIGMGTPLYTFSDKMSRPLGIKSAPLRTIFPDAWEEKSWLLFHCCFGVLESLCRVPIGRSVSIISKIAFFFITRIGTSSQQVATKKYRSAENSDSVKKSPIESEMNFSSIKSLPKTEIS